MLEQEENFFNNLNQEYTPKASLDKIAYSPPIDEFDTFWNEEMTQYSENKSSSDHELHDLSFLNESENNTPNFTNFEIDFFDLVDETNHFKPDNSFNKSISGDIQINLKELLAVQIKLQILSNSSDVNLSRELVLFHTIFSMISKNKHNYPRTLYNVQNLLELSPKYLIYSFCIQCDCFKSTNILNNPQSETKYCVDKNHKHVTFKYYKFEDQLEILMKSQKFKKR
ncbi:hypothetical protein M0813_18956 [Anaeramoeba flamelloides]|uniref:Uncharacterized protein n=1 Tax=Anaeramoeba flamelloides TaxID=1746091 RepID=A0ABQ8YS34_9EUKA|nr:hypothetical protein M0813_18956 [Anaeramoeba flamelloides]